jgi:hypothetical protein
VTQKEIIKAINEFYTNIEKFEKWQPNKEHSKEANQKELTDTYNGATTALDNVIKTLQADKDNKVWDLRQLLQKKSADLWEGK